MTDSTEVTPGPTGDAPRRAVVDGGPTFIPRPRTKLRIKGRLHPSRRVRRLMLLLGLLVVAYLVFVGYTARHVLHQLESGKSALEQARNLTSDADLQAASAVAPLRDGQSKLASAHDDLESNAMRPLQWLPLVGRQIRSASALANAGARSAAAVADAIGSLRAATASPPPPGGRLELLRQFSTTMVTARLRLGEVKLGPDHGLLTRLADARNELTRELVKSKAALDKAVAVGSAGVDLVAGHHRVLILLLNNSEMRAGSGMANVLGLLHVDNGRVTMEPTQVVADVKIPPGSVPATGDFGARWGWLKPTDDWQELLSTARFDATAPLAAKMWQAAGGGVVDAVMAVDPFTLQAIVTATGPATFGGRTIGAADVPAELLHTQYEQYTVQQNATRHDELGDLTRASIAKLDSGGWSASTLALRLAAAVRGRHLMIWSSSSAAELAWINAGAAGLISPNSVMVSLLNRGRDKADYYTYTAAGLDPRATPTGTDFTMTVAVDNRAPTTDVPYVIGPGENVQSVVRPGETVAPGDYVGILAVNLPAAATDVHIVNDPSPLVIGPDGRSFVIGEQYLIKRGTTLLVTIRFHLPPSERVLHLEPAARAPSLYWRFPGNKFVPADTAHTIAW